jgi:hypothetical protein
MSSHAVPMPATLHILSSLSRMYNVVKITEEKVKSSESSETKSETLHHHHHKAVSVDVSHDNNNYFRVTPLINDLM